MLDSASHGSLVEAVQLKKYFWQRSGPMGREKSCIKAVDGVSLGLEPNEAVGLAGESGSGKSTFGRCLLRISEPTDGRILFDGADITRLSPKELRPLRADMQMIFQSCYSSLDPRMLVKDIVAEPLVVQKRLRKQKLNERVRELLHIVGLERDIAYRLPRELSGGQRQRIAIARALALSPKLIVLDEPTSALDVSVQAKVLNLLLDLRKSLGLSYLFISHDLSVIRYVCDRVGVMYLGVIVEMGSVEEVFQRPMHPYTKALLSAIPEPDPDHSMNEISLEGDVYSAHHETGCRFAPRCFAAMVRECRQQEPSLREVEPGHAVACHLF